MRKIIVYIATSADGFIARKDGGIDWLDRPRTAGDYGMAAFWKSIDTILLGRKTYDLVVQFQKEGKDTPDRGTGIRNYAFSRRPPRKVLPGFEFVKEPIKKFAKRLRSQKGKNIFMMGGGGVIASFLDEGEIDQFIIHVIPVFIGEGIPLIAPRHRTVPLTLLSTKKYSDGVVRLHYEVLKGKPKTAKKRVSEARPSGRATKRPRNARR